ncbi:hypothetical protein DSM104443_01651 [Usitatibacter rugosus]|uniref:Uncharacterized protein n=1 Tax=Usitatibacter rugosus TaxID=2732067 RepID=A0A6M4GYI7_9PROT|nr:hypothetical protein [Usitatibacter rugosus]QJR10587.1 hypothetical protein DSM104443_01651 [Usitatibacter rugosus]
MTEVVRVSVGEDVESFSWPPRCARCGKAKPLKGSTSRVGRVKSMRPNLAGGMTMKSDVLYLTAPMCTAHAGSNELANKILEKSPLMLLLRAIVYIGFLYFVLFALRAVVDPKAIRRLFELGVLALLPFIGFFGILLLYWARKNTSVWPVRFDPDMDVVEVRFSDAEYAEDFRKANPDATDTDVTGPPPWYMRSLLWKVVIIVAFLFYMFRMTSPS